MTPRRLRGQMKRFDLKKRLHTVKSVDQNERSEERPRAARQTTQNEEEHRPEKMSEEWTDRAA